MKKKNGPDDPAGDDATVGKKKQKKMDVDVGVPIIDWSIKTLRVPSILFAHVTKLIAVGHVRRVEPEDLAHLEELESAFLHENFEKEWEEEKRSKGKARRRSSECC